MADSLGTAVVEVVADTSRFESSTRRGITGIATSVTRTVARIAGAVAAVGAVVAGIAVRGGIRRALDTENARVLMGQLGLSVLEIDAALQAVDRTFLGTPFANPQGFNISAQLLATGRTLGDVEQDLKNIANFTALTLNKDLDATSEIFLKMSSQGRIFARDLNSLALQGVPIRQILAEGLNVSVEALNEMVSRGEITYDVIQDIITASGQFEGAAQSMGKTTTGAFRNVLTGVARLGEKLVSPLFGEDGPMVRFFQNVRDALFDAGPAMERIGELLGDILIPKLDSLGSTIATKLGPAMERFADWLAGLDENAGVFDIILELARNALGRLGTVIIEGAKGAFGSGFFNAILEGARAAFDGLLDWLSNGGIPAILNLLTQARTRLLEAAMVLFPAILEAASTFLPELLRWLGSEFIPQILTFLVESIPDLLDTAVVLFESLVDALIVIIPELVDTLANDVIPALLDALIVAIPRVLDAAVRLVLKLVDALLIVLPQIINTLVNVVIPQVIRALISMSPQLLMAAFTLFKGLGDALIRSQPIIAKLVVELLWGIIKSLVSFQVEMYKAGLRLLSGLWDGIKEVGRKIVNWVKENVVQKIKNLWPFSPAKEGPFAGSGSPFHAGENIMEMLAEGLRKATPAVIAAAEAATRQLQGGVGGVTVPRMAGAAAGGTVVHLGGVEVNMSFDGDITPFRAREAGSAAAAALIERLSREVLVT